MFKGKVFKVKDIYNFTGIFPWGYDKGYVYFFMIWHYELSFWDNLILNIGFNVKVEKDKRGFTDVKC